MFSNHKVWNRLNFEDDGWMDTYKLVKCLQIPSVNQAFGFLVFLFSKCYCLQAIFIGYGPGIHYKTTVAPFENIEVYNLLCGKFCFLFGIMNFWKKILSSCASDIAGLWFIIELWRLLLLLFLRTGVCLMVWGLAG